MALTGFRAANHPQQTARRGPTVEVDDRATHPTIFDPLHERFGFTIDVAAAAHNTKCDRYYDRTTDGLAQSWAGEMVWCNPPYSSIEPWVRKAWDEWATAKGIVMLLPANRTEQAWWQDLVEPHRDEPGGGPVGGVPPRPDPLHQSRPDRRRPEREAAVRLLPPDLGEWYRMSLIAGLAAALVAVTVTGHGLDAIHCVGYLLLAAVLWRRP
jgi:hypothetical protein